VTVEFRFDRFFRTDQQHAHAVIARRMNRPFDFRLGARSEPIASSAITLGMVAGVAGFFDLQHVAAL